MKEDREKKGKEMNGVTQEANEHIRTEVL